MYYFVVNPQARSGKGKITWEKIEKVLQRREIPYEVLFTEMQGQAGLLARKAAENRAEDKIIVAIGGDGTVSEIMSGIFDHPEITFGYIPVGSGNDFARGLGISTDWREALEGVLAPKHRIFLHPGRLEFDRRTRHFGESMGIGFDAAVCSGANRLRFKSVFNRLGLGKFTYTGIALKLLITSSCDRMKIRLDGKAVHTFSKVLFACGMNGPYEGGGFKFAPEASVDDGMIHLCVAAGLPIYKRFLLLPKALAGKHVGAEGIYMFTCKKAEIISSRPKFIQGDGEVFGPVKKVTASVEDIGIPFIY